MKSIRDWKQEVFQDLGVHSAHEQLIKAELVFKIDAITKQRRLKQAEAADLLVIKQPDISKILRGHFRPFSMERLLRFFAALNQDVEILGKPHRGPSAAYCMRRETCVQVRRVP